MDKEEIYQLIKEQTESMHLTFQKHSKGADFGFKISNYKDEVYGSVYSSKLAEDIYLGISKKSFDFYNFNGKKNFIVSVDTVENHFLVIPFEVMKNDFFPRRSGKNVHYDFNISRYPYRLQKSKIGLKKYIDNLDIIFEELNSKNSTSKDSTVLTEQESNAEETVSYEDVEVSDIEDVIEKALDLKDMVFLKNILTGEIQTYIAQRIGQDKIRRMVLKNYHNQCALCDVNDSHMLVASHIIPWKENKILRGKLDNVICLCVMHDKLFELGKIGIGTDYQVIFSKSFLKDCETTNFYQSCKLATLTKLNSPLHLFPSKEYLANHRKTFSLN